MKIKTHGAVPIQQPTVDVPVSSAPVHTDMVVTCHQCEAWRPLRNTSPFGQCTHSMKFGASPVMRADLDPACSQAILPKV